MPTRGRLIWPMQARISRLDTAATAANNLGEPSGYDRTFREPVRNTAGADSRVYMPQLAVSCQVNTEKGSNAKVVQLPGGLELEYNVRTTLHYGELETRGLMASNGASVFKPGDRLDAIYKRDGVTLLQDYEDMGYLYLVHIQDRSWGLSGLSRNLLMLYWADRREGAP